jgi:hypothetical protein
MCKEKAEERDQAFAVPHVAISAGRLMLIATGGGRYLAVTPCHGKITDFRFPFAQA